MDFVALAFYAAVCGVLSLAAPNMGGRVSRLAIGAVVGLIAATLLPVLRDLAG